MESENKPQIAEVEAGKTFLIYDVTHITAAAPAPLAEVQTDVATAIRLSQGEAKARIAAQKVLAEVRKGMPLAQALAGLGVKLPAISPVQMTRQQLASMQGQQPPALGLLFAMAPGTVKLIAAPRNSGWMVVRLDAITPGATPAGDPLIAAITPEMGKLLGREYTEALRRAIRGEVGVTRNETAIKAVAAQLAGGN